MKASRITSTVSRSRPDARSVAIVFLILTAIPAASPAWAGSLTDFNFYRPITLNGSSALAMGYSLNVTVNTQDLIGLGQMNPDGRDLAVAWFNGSAWVEIDTHIRIPGQLTFSTSTQTQVWFAVQENGGISSFPHANAYRLYYSNPAAFELDRLRNGKNIYRFFDHFPGTSVDSSAWYVDPLDQDGVAVAASAIEIDGVAGAATKPLMAGKAASVIEDSAVVDASAKPRSSDSSATRQSDSAGTRAARGAASGGERGDESASSAGNGTDRRGPAIVETSGPGPRKYYIDGDGNYVITDTAYTRGMSEGIVVPPSQFMSLLSGSPLTKALVLAGQLWQGNSLKVVTQTTQGTPTFSVDYTQGFALEARFRSYNLSDDFRPINYLQHMPPNKSDHDEYTLFVSESSVKGGDPAFNFRLVKVIDGGGPGTGSGLIANHSAVIQTNQWYVTKVTVLPINVPAGNIRHSIYLDDVFLDDSLDSTVPVYDPTVTSGIVGMCSDIGTAGAIDWFVVRRLVANEPTSALGSPVALTTPTPTATATPTVTPTSTVTPTPTWTPTPTSPPAVVKHEPSLIILHHPAPFALVTAATAQIPIRVSNVANLGAFQYGVSFNPSVVFVESAARVRLGPFLGSTGNSVQEGPVALDNVTGAVGFSATASGPFAGPSGSGNISTIQWSSRPVVQTATSALQFQSMSLQNLPGQPIPALTETAVIKVYFHADIDGNNVIDVVDIQFVAGRWNTVIGNPLYDPIADVDRDGDIDVVDIQAVSGRWNEVAPFAP